MASITIDRKCCKGCNICLTVCPKNIFIRSKFRNDYGTAMPGIKNSDSCVRCRMCERMCPDGAIDVEEDEEE
ncbi:MAG: 4Fe-4S binding protein [Clostridiales bacterium]|nr:4Fe-4S binding protein [Clostridiales bacterium]